MAKRKKAQKVPKGPPPTTRMPIAESPKSLDELWASSRQGARNIAGVTYQLAVTAYLLTESRRGVLPFVEITPEGLEDIDCRDGDGRKWLVQAKERAAGTGRISASALADVISHAAPAAEAPGRIVVVTDATLGRQLTETGWTACATETPGFDVSAVAEALEKRGHTKRAARSLVERAYVVLIPWHVASMAIDGIEEFYDVPAAVASMLFGAVLDDIANAASQQRHTTPATALSRRVGDLDAVVTRALDTIDRSALTAAVDTGVCSSADYSRPPSVDLRTFLMGVDANPSHIGAGHDVRRPGPSAEIRQALEQERYAVIAGPSGSGKSVQLWRSARDCDPGATVVRVLRVQDASDVRNLVRHVELLRPSETRSVVVACDDLGRPSTASWPPATRQLLEIPHVFLIGAVRQEDLDGALLRHGGLLIEMKLDDETAEAIAAHLLDLDVPLNLEIAEAKQKADGHLMEFIALLTTGRRMRSVLAAQADRLLTDPIGVDAAVARLVCAGHTLGVSIPAEELSRTVDVEPSELTSALRRLQNEHIVTSTDQQHWRGLHQRRSQILTELLHETPPPTLTATLLSVVGSIRPNAIGWAIRRIIEVFDLKSGELAESAAEAASRCDNALDLASLLEGLERADHSDTARSYVPILDRHRRPSVSVRQWSFLVIAYKLSGVDFGGIADGPLERMAEAIRACADELPERSRAFSEATLKRIGEERIIDLATEADLEPAVRLLDAASPYLSLTRQHRDRVCRAFAWPRGLLSNGERRLRARLLTALYTGASDGSLSNNGAMDVGARLLAGAAAHPDVLSASLGSDGVGATAALLASLVEGSPGTVLPWDPVRTISSASNALNDRAVGLATYLGECCPELEVVEVRAVGADGEPMRIADMEPGYKRLGRKARPPTHAVRVNVGLLAAIARRSAASSWTELIRQREQIADVLLRLVSDAPRRLNPFDNPRRREVWRADLSRTDERLAAMPSIPVRSQLDAAGPAVRWDAVDREDELGKGLAQIATALGMVVPGEGGRFVPLGVARQLSQARQQMSEALSNTDELTTGRERALYQQLDQELGRFRGLLAAQAFNPLIAAEIRGRDLSPVIARLVGQAMKEQEASERDELDELLRSVPFADLIRADDPDPFVSSVGGHQWITTVSPDTWPQAVAVLADAASSGRLTVDAPVSLACTVDGRLLPIAGRAARTMASGFLPLDPGSVERLGVALAMDVVDGPYLRTVPPIGDNLAKASWLAARRRLRDSTWPVEEADPMDDLGQALTAIHDLKDPRLRTGLLALADSVRAELDGSAITCFAAEITNPDQMLEITAEPTPGMELLNAAVLHALDLELGLHQSPPVDTDKGNQRG